MNAEVIRQRTLPIQACSHLEALVQAIKPLTLELSDGYSDDEETSWFKCPEHKEALRIDYDGDIVDYRAKDDSWVWCDGDKGELWVKRG